MAIPLVIALGLLTTRILLDDPEEDKKPKKKTYNTNFSTGTYQSGSYTSPNVDLFNNYSFPTFTKPKDDYASFVNQQSLKVQKILDELEANKRGTEKIKLPLFDGIGSLGPNPVEMDLAWKSLRNKHPFDHIPYPISKADEFLLERRYGPRDFW